MVNLPNYNIYLKLMVDGVTSRPFSALTLPPLALATHEDNQDKVIELSKKNYARPKSEVEYEISSSSGIMANMPNGQVGKPGFLEKKKQKNIRKIKFSISKKRRLPSKIQICSLILEKLA